MQSEDIGAVRVTRGWGDWRKLDVPLDALSGWHVAVAQGGHGARLPKPALAAYMSCEEIPSEADFGHSCVHGPPPHRIKVIVQRVDNRAAYPRLKSLAHG